MSPEELDAAVDVHRAERLAAVSDALDRLAAAAEDARSTLYAATRDLGYRPVADATGLPLATVQRWRVELPVQPVLRRRDSR